MPIVIKLRERARRLRVDVVTEWREQPVTDWAGQVEDYCQSWGSSVLSWRCPHGVRLTDDPDELMPYCSICNPVSPENPHLFSKRQRIGLSWLLGFTRTDVPKIDRFRRKGHREISKTGYYDFYFYELGGELYWMPPDHYVSPYDERLRCRKTEMAWYYVPGKTGDGVGVRVQMGWGETLEGDLRQHRRSISEDEPDDSHTQYGPRFDGRLGWHYEKADLKRLKRDFSPRYRSTRLSLPPNATVGEVARTYFDDERTVMEYDGLYRSIGGHAWTDRKAPALRDPFTPHDCQDLTRLLNLKKCTAGKYLTESEKAVDLTGRWWERWDGHSWTQPKLLDKDVKRWRAVHWKTRAKYQPPPQREKWPDGWQNERKMRDLAAKLDMHSYGDGRLQPEKMHKAAWRNLREFQVRNRRDYGITGRERPCWGEWAVGSDFWPSTKGEGGSVEHEIAGGVPMQPVLGPPGNHATDVMMPLPARSYPYFRNWGS